MNKFSKKIISLISSSLLSIASVSGVKGMYNYDESMTLRNSESSDDEALDLDDVRRGRIFQRKNSQKLTFQIAWESERENYLKHRTKALEHGGYNVLTEAPYNITNLVANNPKKIAAFGAATALIIGWYLNSYNLDYDDEEDEY